MTYCRAGEPPFRRSFVLGERQLEPELAQLSDEREVLRVGEPLRDQLGTLGPDPFDLLELLERRRRERVDRSEVEREAARDHPADLRDVEAEEDAGERLLLRALDRLERARGGDLGEALELGELLGRQPVEIREASGRSPRPRAS